MENIRKYNDVFKSSFGIGDEQLSENLQYNTIDEWDSVGHMSMIAELEESFAIELEMDEIIDFSSYNKGKEILKNHGIIFE